MRQALTYIQCLWGLRPGVLEWCGRSAWAGGGGDALAFVSHSCHPEGLGLPWELGWGDGWTKQAEERLSVHVHGEAGPAAW